MLLHGVPQKALDVVSGMNLFMDNNGFIKKNTYLCETVSHCAFSTNLFHGQIAQIYIDNLSGHENQKCSP